MEKAKGVPQFVGGFLEEALLDHLAIFGQPVKFVVQAAGTEEGAIAVAAHSPVHECLAVEGLFEKGLIDFHVRLT